MSPTPIIWSPNSKETYSNILNYLIQEWSIKVARSFDEKVSAHLNLLSSNLELCPESSIKNIRRCVLTKQLSLTYRILESNVELISFFDNRSDHHY